MSIQDWNDPRGVEIQAVDGKWLPAKVVQVLENEEKAFVTWRRGLSGRVFEKWNAWIRHPPAKPKMPDEVKVFMSHDGTLTLAAKNPQPNDESYTRTASLGEKVWEGDGNALGRASVRGPMYAAHRYALYKLPEPQS